MKYFKSLAVTLIGLSIGLAILGSVRAQDTKIVVASSASLYPQYYPLAMAENQGYFKEAGLSIEELSAPGGANVNAVISGNAQFGLAPMASTIMAAAKGAPIRVICAAPDFLKSIVFAVKANSEIKTMAGLKGGKAKLGYSSGGSITDTISAAALTAENLTGDVERIALGSGPAITTALLTDQIQVEVNNISAIAALVLDGKIRVIGTASDYMKNYETAAIIVNLPYLQQNAKQAKAFITAYVKGIDYANAHKDEVTKYYAKRANVSLETAKIALKYLSWPKKVDKQGFMNQLNLLKQDKQIDASVNGNELFENFVDLSMVQ